MEKTNYLLLDSGNQKKLEQFGPYLISRPCSQAVWHPQLDEKIWQKADANFTRRESHRWQGQKPLPTSWQIEFNGIRFKLVPTEFGHLGFFPEHAMLWKWAAEEVKKSVQPLEVLNLFAYSGAATLACAKAGAKVCHLDASKAAVDWARENAKINGLEGKPIRWIVEDVNKFLKREIKRGRKYQGILLDPPSFGRGNKAEVFILEQDLLELLDLCTQLLADDAKFLILSSHTPGMTPLVLNHLLSQFLKKRGGKITSGELIIPAEKGGCDLPSGAYARWQS